MIDPTNPTTWHWKHALATWRFEAPLRRDDPRSEALAESVRRALAALGDFGTVSRVEWASSDGGDHAGVASPTSAAEATMVCRDLAHVSDILTVRCHLDLAVSDADGTQATLREGATLWFDLDADEVEQVFVQLRLNVDIHAPVTWGANRDNRLLAALNGPRLTMFLRRLAAELGARVEDVDAPSYRGLAHADGFYLPG